MNAIPRQMRNVPGLKVSEVVIRQALITENYYYKKFSDVSVVCSLNEEFSNYRQDTADDVFDKAVQLLVIGDYLDALQEVVLDDDVVVLCFDPILGREDIEDVLITLKQPFPQASIVSSPEVEENHWWVIEIRDIDLAKDKIAKINNSTDPISKEELDRGLIAKQGSSPVAAVVADVDTEQALSDITKG